MALPVGTQFKYWALAAVVFFVVLWFLGDVIMPFLIGGAIAYFLDPIADKLETWGFKRIWATATISVLAIIVFVLLILLVVPSLINQAGQLVNVAPQIAQNIRDFLIERFPDVVDQDSVLRQSLDSLGSTLQERGGQLIDALLNSAMGIVNVALLVVIVPVVTFYLLWDWDRMVAAIDDLLPRDHAPVIRHLASQIDRTLAGFIRGQGTVCLILGTFYAVALMLIGLQFGLIVGAVAGLLTFIPYVGALVGGALAIGLGLFQFWGEWWLLGGVVAIFLVGQFVEGNVLTPNLVGTSVGLHPVWLIFALSAFGTVFGFVGMLVAVPVAAALGVVTRYLIQRYKEGRLYKGLSEGALLPQDQNDET
ncbi:AI-2E family transporter [Maritimibacter sp. UBA3975]|uniref:AI-2E family transporter n=1 Tax=Maritimibacter sp. UBA3975 TaxID=1946833 RepID=UPI000C0A4875|nr:AI-2E family transporter [Maritimibacter sp. UBA3975]MAM62646.1 AI-2E family transporter [Maritimibacter sp.]|tara:strand:+ start:26936 stop:28027 length:1092 start_codon:yes stop_codon:yes gene_type:complete